MKLELKLTFADAIAVDALHFTLVCFACRDIERIYLTSAKTS